MLRKALLMASVFIGAFFYQSANAQVLVDGRLGEYNEAACPFGGNYSSVLRFCFVPATLSSEFEASTSVLSQTVKARGDSRESAIASLQQKILNLLSPTVADLNSGRNSSALNCERTISSNEWSFSSQFINQNSQNLSFVKTAYGSSGNGCIGYGARWELTGGSVVIHSQVFLVSVYETDEIYQCPPESSNENFTVFNFGPYETEEGYNICFYMANDPDNDADDNCPPDTIGGCDPPEPDCFDIGNGATICKADPNEKCDVSYVNGQPVFTNCETGCGFEGLGTFVCTSEPDSDGEIPDLSKCFRVATGWACPSDPDGIPEPDDDITDPNKPLSDMTKGDFKQVNRGIETRIDATNSLLSDIKGIGAATNKGIGDLNAKATAANGLLRDIRQNTGATADNTKGILDQLTGEGSEPLDLDNDWRGVFSSALGITGDETIDELTKTEITLDQFKSEFQWSGTSSACPAPRSINIIGASFSMDWQPFCTAFNVLGYFILAAAYLLSIRIAFGSRS